MTDLEYVRRVINEECIYRVPLGSKELPSIDGQTVYSWQFYLRQICLNPVCLNILTKDFWTRYEEAFKAEPFQLAGVESSSTPIITALILDASKRGLNVTGFSIRKDRKSYGRRNLIEGKYDRNLRVFYVDDLTSPTHKTFWHAVHACSLHDLKLYPHGYVLVMKQKADEPKQLLTSLGSVLVGSLFSLDDFAMTYADYAREQLLAGSVQ